MLTFPCERCGVSVTARKVRRFCTTRCSNARRDKYVYSERTCVGCGEKFTPVPKVGRPDRKYCTGACYRASTNVQVTKHCPVCDTDYTVPRSTAHRYTVCSTACRTAETKYVDCERCGTRFRAEKRLNSALLLRRVSTPTGLCHLSNLRGDVPAVPLEGQR